MKAKTTRRALFMSFMSLLLCCSMLIGTTYAWFTDSVTSANNIIKSGNLDVELEYAKVVDGQLTAWDTVGGKDNIFDRNALWEPGRVEIVYLKVSNLGSLALKYQLGVNIFGETIGKTEGGNDIRLSDHLVFKVVDVENADGTINTYTDREAVATAAGTEKGLRDYNGDTKTLDPKNGTNDEDYIALIVYMPTTVGNEANYRGTAVPTINLGINLYATQLAAEEDSFGPDYDEDAVYPGSSDASNLGNEAITLVTEGNNESTVVIPAELVNEIDDGSVTSISIKSDLPDVQTDAEGNVNVVYHTFDIVDQNENVIDLSGNTAVIPVKLYVGTEYAGKYASISHDDVLIATAVVEADGYVSYNTTHFCEISIEISDEAPKVEIGDVKDETAEDLTKLVQVLVGNHYYTISQGMANSWKTLSNAEQIVADIYVPEDLIAYAMMYNNGDITANSGVHSDLTLKNSLDYAKYNWVPIGRFFTNIHGAGKTISNLNNSFLGCVYDCHIENLTLENVTASGSVAGVVAKELAGDIFISNLTIAGNNTVTYIKDNASNWPEGGIGVGAVSGVSLIGCAGQGNVDITVTGTIDVNYNDVFFGNNTNLENLGVSKEFGLNVYKANANANVTVAAGGAINTNGQGYLFDAADIEDGFANDALTGKYYVLNAEGLSVFAAEVNAGNNFSKKTVVLYTNIDLENKEWTPIGTSSNIFKGTFDGNGKTIKNLNVNMPGKSDVGLFGVTHDGEIKNLTVENATVTGRLDVGVVAGTPYTSKYTNITLKGHVEVNGMSYVGGIGGKNAYANWNEIEIAVDGTSYVKANSVENGNAYRSYVGGVIGFMGEGGHKMSNIKSNINVIGSTCDVGGVAGIAHYGNVFENIVCSGNVTVTDAPEAADAEEMGGIAGVWHNENGTTVTFNNCKYTGKLTANAEGVDLSDNTIVGAAYSATGTGKLLIDNKVVVVLKLPETFEDGKDALDTLDDAFKNNKGGYVSLESDITGSADRSNAYGATGVSIGNGETIDGNGHTLEVKDCNGTWDSAINITGGTIKNLTINSGFRGVFVNHNSSNSGKVYLENVIIDGPVYTISCDQGTNSGLEAINSVFNGWTSYAATIGDVKFVDCSFGEGAGYAFCRPYAKTEFVNCNFESGYEMDPQAAVSFENCYFDNVLITAENVDELVVSNLSNVTVK